MKYGYLKPHHQELFTEDNHLEALGMSISYKERSKQTIS